MANVALSAETRRLLAAMSDAELAESLHGMSARSATTNGTMFAVICQGLARIVQKFADSEIVYEPDDFKIGQIVKIDMRTEEPVRVVGYDAHRQKWVLYVDGEYEAWLGKDIHAPP